MDGLVELFGSRFSTGCRGLGGRRHIGHAGATSHTDLGSFRASSPRSSAPATSCFSSRIPTISSRTRDAPEARQRRQHTPFRAVHRSVSPARRSLRPVQRAVVAEARPADDLCCQPRCDGEVAGSRRTAGARTHVVGAEDDFLCCTAGEMASSLEHRPPRRNLAIGWERGDEAERPVRPGNDRHEGQVVVACRADESGRACSGVGRICKKASATFTSRHGRIVFSGGWAAAAEGTARPPVRFREGALLLDQARSDGIGMGRHNPCEYADIYTEIESRCTLENVLRVKEGDYFEGVSFTACNPLGLASTSRTHGSHPLYDRQSLRAAE